MSTKPPILEIVIMIIAKKPKQTIYTAFCFQLQSWGPPTFSLPWLSRSPWFWTAPEPTRTRPPRSANARRPGPEGSSAGGTERFTRADAWRGAAAHGRATWGSLRVCACLEIWTHESHIFLLQQGPHTFPKCYSQKPRWLKTGGDMIGDSGILTF